MTKRRNLKALTRALARARSRQEKAMAEYGLGLFHDNNSREAQAVPHYRQAIRLELERRIKAEALAWLASSLYKTGRRQAALRRLYESRQLTRDPSLVRFLRGLERRIAHRR